MKRTDRERLADIAEAIRAIRKHVATSPADAGLRRDAILYNLVILGEAVKGLSEETRALRPKIPWRQIAGLRDLLAHEYFRIDMAEITKIIERDLAPLEQAVAALRTRRAR